MAQQASKSLGELLISLVLLLFPPQSKLHQVLKKVVGCLDASENALATFLNLDREGTVLGRYKPVIELDTAI